MNLKKLLVFSFCLLAVSSTVLGQDNTTTAQKRFARPNIPGTFVVELGINRATNRADNFMLYFWGSRSMNIYYQYDMRILKSKFSFHPGIGFGLDRYKFRKNYILGYGETGEVEMLTPSEYRNGVSNVRKSQLITNYLDVPMELRFSTNPEDPSRSFKMSIGGRAGFLFDSHTKVKYREGGDKIKLKEKRNFDLNQFRYGVYMKIGAGNFSVMGYYNLSPLFRSGQGPLTGTDAKDMNNFTVGISLSSF